MVKRKSQIPADVVTHDEDPFLSWSEAGRMVGKSPQTVARWAAEGLIECVRVAGVPPRIRLSALRKFLGGTALEIDIPE